MIDSYNNAVAQVLARTEYGQRTETALAAGFVVSWSNGSREWWRGRSVRRGEQFLLDANQIVVYAKARSADKIASHLPALPLDASSHEAKERGPEPFLSNPKKTPDFHEGQKLWVKPDHKIIKVPAKGNHVDVAYEHGLADYVDLAGGGDVDDGEGEPIRPYYRALQAGWVRVTGDRKGWLIEVRDYRKSLDQLESFYFKYQRPLNIETWEPRLADVWVTAEDIEKDGFKDAVVNAFRRKGTAFGSNPKGPEEDWINLPESGEGTHEFHDPTHSPYEGDIPPWGQQGYEGGFPMASRVYYVNAYAVVEFKTSMGFKENLQRYGTHHSVGSFPQHLLTGADFDYYPFAAIPVRREEGASPGYFFKYLERIAHKVPLTFLKIVIENDFPKGMQHSVYDPEAGREVVSDVRGKVKLPDGRYFEYTMRHPFKHPKVGYVNAYVENRIYGGPEEGGWWYNAGFPVAAIPFVKNGEFTESKMTEYLQKTIGYHQKYPLSSVLGHDTLSIATEDAFPAEYPQETPHYE